MSSIINKIHLIEVQIMQITLSQSGSRCKKRSFYIASALVLLLTVALRLVFSENECGKHIYILGFSAYDSKFLWYFKTAVILLEFFFVDSAIYTLLFRSFRWHVFFAALVFSFGILFMFTITPMSVPDEITHFNTVNSLSGNLTGRKALSSYADMSGFSNHSNVSTGYLRILHDLGGSEEITSAASVTDPIGGMWTLTYFMEYVPQLIGVSLALIFGRNTVTAFMLGRFFNLLFYCVCVYLAVKRAPKFKVLLGLTALMPMALQQSASLSYDCFIDALSLLLIASLLYSVFSEDGFNVKELLFILIPAALLAPAKGVYSLFVLLFLFAPSSRFESSRIKKLPVFFIILGSCAVLFAAVSIPTILRIMNSTPPGFEAVEDSAYKLSYFLTAPFDALKIFADTFNLYISDWLTSAVGRSLSTFTLNIPTWIVPVYIVCLVLSVQNRSSDTSAFPKGFRISLIAISAFVIFSFMMTMFLTWIRNTDKIIIGVQGRYFIPIIPLLALSLNSRLIELKRDADRNITLIAIVLVARVILDVVNQTMFASV